MKRAAILIGVDRTGDLPKLKDAARGARLMEAWARSQGIRASVITDEQEPVRVDRIKQEILTLVDAANVGQLIVYFAGHGVNLQRQEYWLLTHAPDDSQAAVNVATSAALAATCGIPHVIFISDACRTAPEGIRAQSVRGSEIFPNREEEMRPVDQFFACQLGKPSHEVRDAAVTASEFKALYTRELAPALNGERAQLIDWTGEAAQGKGRLHLRPLRDHLAAAVAAKLTDLQLQTRVIQVPVAQISSDPPAWISEVAMGAPAAPAATAPPPVGSGPPPSIDEHTTTISRSPGALPSVAAGTVPVVAAAPLAAPEVITAKLLRATMNVDQQPADAEAPATRPPWSEALRESLQIAQPFGPMHHETACGIKLRGARAVEVVAKLQVDLNGLPADDLRVHDPRPGSNVLVVLENGAGVLIPAVPEFICALTFDEDELLDVAYEPSDNTWRWGIFNDRAQEIRTLRGIAASAMSRGSFKLEGEDALAVAHRMQMAKGVDPTLAVYAAYAYHDLQRRDLMRETAECMRADLGGAMFDIPLLARLLDRQAVDPRAPALLGPVPMLSQGWPLRRAFSVRLPSALEALEEHRLPSLWTMFDAKGVDCIRAAFREGVLR